ASHVTVQEERDGSPHTPLSALAGEMSPQVTEGGRDAGSRALPFTSLEHLRRRTGLSVATLERLAANDAFRSLRLDRRQALWTVRGLVSDVQLPLFVAVDTDAAGPDVPVALPAMRKSEHVVADYQTHRLSLKAHPLSFLRNRYRRQGMIAAGDLLSMRNKQRCTLAGVVLVRQRPGTAKGVLFMTLEDETGVANIVVWKKVWESFRQVVMTARLVKITGEVQRSGDVIHVVGYKLEDLTDDLDHLSEADFPEVVARADHVRTPLPSHAGGVSSQAKKRARLEAAGRGIDTIADHLPIPLAHADEVRHPQNDRGGRSRNEEGIPLHVVTGPGRAKLEKPRKSPLSRRGPKPLPAADPPQPSKARHPRNVRVIPKSRDFH
ncbi:MAG: OB-fold nucleic acid binding domain-containing protein, partial [Pseudomonadota bacterium]